MSRSSDIAALLTTRLADVPGVINIFRGKRVIAVEETPCIVLFEGDDRPKDETQEVCLIEQSYVAEWHGPCDENNPNDAAHVAIAEMKQRIWIRKDPERIAGLFRQIRYKGRSIGTREDGSKIASAIVMFSVEFPEDLTNP